MKILVTGKSGSGKSTFLGGFITSLLEAGISTRSANTGSYDFETNLGLLTAFDTPAQEQNRTSNLNWCQENGADIDILYFCIRMNDQVREGDIHALTSLAETFGKTIWNHTVVILTYANQIEPLTPDEGIDDHFKGAVAMMEARVREVLRENVHLESGVVDEIPIVPSGHPLKYTLPNNCSDWRSAVLAASSQRIGGPEYSLLELVVRNASIRVSQTPAVVNSQDSQERHDEVRVQPLQWRKLLTRYACYTIISGTILTVLYNYLPDILANVFPWTAVWVIGGALLGVNTTWMID